MSQACPAWILWLHPSQVPDRSRKSESRKVVEKDWRFISMARFLVGVCFAGRGCVVHVSTGLAFIAILAVFLFQSLRVVGCQPLARVEG